MLIELCILALLALALPRDACGWGLIRALGNGDVGYSQDEPSAEYDAGAPQADGACMGSGAAGTVASVVSLPHTVEVPLIWLVRFNPARGWKAPMSGELV